MGKRRVALDLDGTLITCQARQSAGLRASLLAYGVADVDVRDVWSLKRGGLSTRSALRRQGVNSELSIAVSTHWARNIEHPFWLQFDTVFKETRSALALLGAANFDRVLLTARQSRHGLMQELTRLQLSASLEQIVVVSPERAGERKALAIKNLGVQVFVGDTLSDARAAERASVRFLAVSTGQRSRKFLEEQDELTSVLDGIGDAVRCIVGETVKKG